MPARAWFSVAANRAQPCTIVAAKQHGGHFEHKLGVRKLSYVQLAVGRKAKLRIRVAQIRLAHAICLYDMEHSKNEQLSYQVKGQHYFLYQTSYLNVNS